MKKITTHFTLILLLLMAAQQAFAQKTFTGTSPGSWNVAGNWTPSGVPGASDNVIIPAGKSVGLATAVTRTGTTTIDLDGSLGVAAGGTLTNTGAMTINGSCDLASSSGTCTLNNNSGGTITVTGPADGSNGQILVQSNFSGTSVLNNNSGATITINTTGLLQITGGNNSLVNSGAITNNASYIWLPGGTLNNTGTVDGMGLITGNTGVVSGALYTNSPGSTINGDPSFFAEYSCLSFNNGLTNSGTIKFNVDGSSACNDQDKITVTGAMTFGGTFTTSGTATSGTVTLMTYGSRTGTFTNTSAPLGNGYFLNISPANYGATSLTGTVSAVPLSAELVQFDVENTKGGKNILTWRTASETQNKSFDIERSTDGTRFEKIGLVEGKGTTTITQSYTFEDNKPNKGISYYRLKQLDFDGGFEYSKIISVTQNGKNEASVFPNPSKGVFTIEGISEVKNEHFTVFNSLGQTLSIVLSPNNQLDLSAFPVGIYYLRIGSNGNVRKLFKE